MLEASDRGLKWRQARPAYNVEALLPFDTAFPARGLPTETNKAKEFACFRPLGGDASSSTTASTALLGKTPQEY